MIKIVATGDGFLYMCLIDSARFPMDEQHYSMRYFLILECFSMMAFCLTQGPKHLLEVFKDLHHVHAHQIMTSSLESCMNG